MAEARRVTVEELAEAAFSGVFKALERRKPGSLRGGGEPLIPGPILVGIIWWPDRLPGELPVPGPMTSAKQVTK